MKFSSFVLRVLGANHLGVQKEMLDYVSFASGKIETGRHDDILYICRHVHCTTLFPT